MTPVMIPVFRASIMYGDEKFRLVADGGFRPFFSCCAYHLNAMVFSMCEVHQEAPDDDRRQWRSCRYPEEPWPPLAEEAGDEEEEEEAAAHDDALPSPLVGLGEDGAHDGDEVGGGGEVVEAEHALELLQAHHGGGAAHEPDDGGVRQEVHDEPQPQDPQQRLEHAGEEGGGERDVQVQRRVLRRRHLLAQHRPDQQRRHRHRPHRQVPRAPHHRVHQRRHEARIEAEDGREVGELGVADALGDGEAGNGDAGDEVGLEGAEGVRRRPLHEREHVPERRRRAPPAPALPPHHPERVVRQECLLHVPPQRLQERLRRRHRHPRRPRPSSAAVRRAS
ncbi:Os03g0161302, partial [Oryza sativa Japonica Group]